MAISFVLHRCHLETERFTNDNQYDKYIIENDLEDGILREFLGELNSALISKTSNLKSDQCIENNKIQTDSLSYAFYKIPLQSDTELKTKSILNSKDAQLIFETNSKDDCVNKANNLCEVTNPYFYLSESTTFPAKWIGPYKDIPLPKSTHLKCFKKMYDCCKASQK